MSFAPRLIMLAGAFALVSAPAAADVTAPPGAVVAATDRGSQLSAADTVADHGEDRLVLTLRGSDPTEPTFAASGVGATPLWPNESVLVDHALFSADGALVRLVVGGAVDADIATVEHQYGGKVLRMNTVPGAGYQGRHAGQVRFFAGEITLTLDEWGDEGALRMFDASGALVAQTGDEEQTSDNVSLLGRRVAGTVLRLGAVLISHDKSLPLDATHRESELCLTVKSGDDALGADTADAACQDVPAGPEPMRLGGVRGCGALPSTLLGFVPAATADVAVVLGSGHSVRYATRATPFGRAERVVAAIIPRGEAIRTVTALDGAGHPLLRGNVGLAPPDRGCTTTPARDWVFLADIPPTRVGFPPGTQVAAGEPGGPRLLVREVGEQVCVGLDGLALDAGDCADPPLNSRSAALGTKRYPDGRTAVAGLFAARITALDLELAGGARLLIPATEAPGYGGRFHTALHFAFAILPAGQTPAGGTLLDAGGRRIGEVSVDAPCTCHRPRRLHTVITQRLGHASYRLTALGRGADACIALATGPRQPTECQDYTGGEAIADAIVSCAPRVTVVFGITPHRVRRIAIELASHRHVSAPLRRFANDTAFLAILPRTASVTGVKFVGVRNDQGESTVATPLSGAARQCGYRFNGSL